MKGVGKHSSGALAVTLVEVLVVVAIIGILAALLLPTLGQAKRSVRNVQCKSNQRQTGLLLTLFADDNDHYPLDRDRSEQSDDPSTRNWIEQIAKDGGAGRQLLGVDLGRKPMWYSCPIAERAESSGEGMSPLLVSRQRFFDFQYNSVGAVSGVILASTPLLGLGSAARPLPLDRSSAFTRPRDVVNPTDMIAFGDGVSRGTRILVDGIAVESTGVLGLGGGGSLPSVLGQGSSERGLKPETVATRHSGGANLFFLDGHVEFLRVLEPDLRNPELIRRFNRDNRPHMELR